jgi:hypothetical protein
MVQLEQLAVAALSGDALLLRSLTQDWLRENPCLLDCPRPACDDPTILAIAAGLVELFAERRREAPPRWAHDIGAAPAPVFLVKSIAAMQRLRRLCEAESPAPLRNRKLYAPPNFLEFA